MTEFQSRRELREAERQGLVPKPQQIFDLPTGQISIPSSDSATQNSQPQDVPSVNEMLTRKRLREMERQGILDPLTGSVQVQPVPVETARTYDEVLAETEEPITSSIEAVSPPPIAVDQASEAPVQATQAPVQATQVPVQATQVPVQATQAPVQATQAPVQATQAPVQATDIFHSMAVDPNARSPRAGILIFSILVVLAAAGVAAYMLGIFK